MTFLFGILFFLYSLSITKKFEATVYVKEPTFVQFEKIFFVNKQIIYENEKKTKEYIFEESRRFFDRFATNISSITEFSSFLRTDKNFEEIFESIYKKKLTVENYLQDNNFKFEKKFAKDSFQKEYNINLKFLYFDGIDGENILNNFVQEYAENFKKKYILEKIKFNNVKLNEIEQLKTLYVKNSEKILKIKIFQENLKLKEYINKRTRFLENQLFQYKQALKTASVINLKDSIPTSILKENAGSILNEPSALYFKGTQVLQSEIENIKNQYKNIDKTDEYNNIVSNLENLKNQLENLEKTEQFNKFEYEKLNLEKNNYLLKSMEFKWNPIAVRALKSTKNIHPKSLNYFMLGSIVGFILSLIIIYYRKNFGKKIV